MRSGRAIVVCTVTCAVLGACGFSLDGFSNGAPTNDGGTSGGDATTTPQPDGGGPSDGAASDGGGGAPDAGDLCAAPNLFCRTFDDDSLGGTLADDQSVTAGCVLEATNGSLHASTPAYASGDIPSAEVDYHVTSFGLRNAIDADIFVTTPAWGTLQGSASIFSFAVNGDGHQGVELYIGKSYASVTTTYQSGQYLFDGTSVNIPYDRWVHVRFELDLTPGNGAYTVYFDRQQVGHRQGIAFAAYGQSAFLSATLGLVVPNAPAPALDVRTDNVIVTALP